MAVALGLHTQRLAEVDDLQGRFVLPRSQYESDLARLDMVNEAGSLLGYFRTGTCVFCGADPEHQRVGGHGAQATTALRIAVESETGKTRHLLVGERDAAAARATACDEVIARIEREELRPLEREAAELMTVLAA